jgi:hypothetical protein
MSRLGIPGKEKSTTNAWGFAGWSGKEYRLPNGALLCQGRYFYRHANPTAYLRLYLPTPEGEQQPSPLSSKTKILAYLQALPVPEAVVEARLLAEAIALTKPARQTFTQGRLF